MKTNQKAALWVISAYILGAAACLYAGNGRGVALYAAIVLISNSKLSAIGQLIAKKKAEMDKEE